MSGIYKDKQKDEEQEDSSFDLGYEIPETKGTLDALTAMIRAQHEEEEKKNGKKNTKKKRGGGVICCCGAEGCGIGPMVEKA